METTMKLRGWTLLALPAMLVALLLATACPASASAAEGDAEAQQIQQIVAPLPEGEGVQLGGEMSDDVGADVHLDMGDALDAPETAREVQMDPKADDPDPGLLDDATPTETPEMGDPVDEPAEQRIDAQAADETQQDDQPVQEPSVQPAQPEPKPAPAFKAPSVSYKAKVQKKGWSAKKKDGANVGLAGKGLRLEGLRIYLDTGSLKGGIQYRVHVKGKGWTRWVSNGALAASGSRRIEAVQIRLTGDIAKKYDVVYSSNVQGIGWQSSKNNSLVSGTTGKSLRLEALNVQLVPKDQRTGWYRESKAWRYYQSGTRATSKWVVTKLSPIADRPGKQRYWIDSSSKLAVSRLVNPSKARDRGSYLAYATKNGYVLLGKRTVKGGVMLANSDGLLCSAKGWLNTSDYDGHEERYYMKRTKSGYSVAKTGLFKVGKAKYYGIPKKGYVLRNITTKVSGAWRVADNKGKLKKVNVKTMINAFVNWAVGVAKDPAHGYSQYNRWGPDYDCSSLVIAGLKRVGFTVGNAIYTGNMVSELKKYGFKYYTNMSKLKRGDIVWVHNSRHQHTEIYLGKGKLVGAHSSETGGIHGKTGDQTGREVSVGAYYNMPWMGFLRAS